MKKYFSPLNLLLLAAAIFYLIFIARTSFLANNQRYFTLIDDAMISMRYARNLAQGHGLVWNIGQPPVEGFTNLGWLLVMAILHLIPFSPAYISLVVMLIAAIILLANTFVVFRITQTLDSSARLAPFIAATITAFYFPIVFWSLRGLEVGALTLTIDFAILLALRLTLWPKLATVYWLTLVLGFAVLIRMDAFLQAAILLIYISVTLNTAKGFRLNNRDSSATTLPQNDTTENKPFVIGLPVLFTLLVLAGILIFQRFYFGDFLPNTYYLKVTGVTAWERIRVGLLSLNDYASRDFLMPLVFALIGLATIKELHRRESLLLLSLFLVQIGYSVWVGGDYAEELVNAANRFIAQGMPALFILFALVLDHFVQNVSTVQFRPIVAIAIGIGALFVVSGEPWANWMISNAPMLRTDIQRVRIGLHIKATTKPDAVIAVHAAGQIPYFSERTAIDLLGKSDPVIAKGPPATSFAPGHNKWNYSYSILTLKPDLIADNFNKLAAFMKDVSEYRLLPNGIYVRVDSTRVNFVTLAKDYK